MAHPEYLLHNNGDLTFTDVSAQVGLPTTQQEDNGVAWADYDNDGLLDVLVGYAGTGFEKLYHNDGTHFIDVATASGFNASSRPARSVSWCDQTETTGLTFSSATYSCSRLSTTTTAMARYRLNVTASAGMTALLLGQITVGAGLGRLR